VDAAIEVVQANQRLRSITA